MTIVSCSESLQQRWHQTLMPLPREVTRPIVLIMTKITVTGVGKDNAFSWWWLCSENYPAIFLDTGYLSPYIWQLTLIQSDLDWNDWITVNMAHNGDVFLNMLSKTDHSKLNRCSYHMFHSHFWIFFFFTHLLLHFACLQTYNIIYIFFKVCILWQSVTVLYKGRDAGSVCVFDCHVINYIHFVKYLLTKNKGRDGTRVELFCKHMYTNSTLVDACQFENE